MYNERVRLTLFLEACLFKKIKAYFDTYPSFVRSYRILLSATKSFSDNAISAMGAQLAYYLIVAFFTLGVTIAYASRLVPSVAEGALHALQELFPATVSSLFTATVDEVNIPKTVFPMASTAVMSIWFASRAIRSMMRSFDTIFMAAHRRKSYQRTYLSILFTLIFELLFAIIIVFSMLGKTISKSILMPLEISNGFVTLWTYVRLIFPGIAMLFAFWLFYFYLTNVKIKFRHAFPGAAFTTTLWLVITRFFSLYLQKFSLFPLILGSVGGIFAFLIWIYWSSIIILVGAVLNFRFMQWRTGVSLEDMNKPIESE